jgi:uncharacterized protein (DUF983 family)
VGGTDDGRAPAWHTGPVGMSPSVVMRRGLCKRCPVCGQGHLFRHWITMADECPRCGLHFHRTPGQWMGSWFLNLCVGQTAIVLVLVVGVALTYPTPPMLVVGGLGLLAAVAVPLAFFPFSRTLWTAMDLLMAPLELDEGVAPGYELDHDATLRDLRG